MKSLKTLVKALTLEIGSECCTDTTRDLIEIDARCRHEGEGFLTFALPSFVKAFEYSLDQGRIVPELFAGFSLDKRSKRPRFLGGLMALVFGDDGRLLTCPPIAAIQGVRQIGLVVSKIFEVCDDERVDVAISGYKGVERELEEYWFDPNLLREVRITADQVFGLQLGQINQTVRSGNLIPRHGPGATADRLLGNQKYDSPYWTQRMEQEFSMADYLLCGYSHYRRLRRVELRGPGAEEPVRVIPVPKTAAKARIIAAEPANVQYVQQALLREFASLFCGDSRFVALNNQERNRVAARRGSLDGSVATLDLSEASDRLAVPVVEAVFHNYPDLLRALMACRSTRAKLPSGEIISLRKFASMGSATCFPVESICFAAIALTAIRLSLSPPSWRAFLRERHQDVMVFGDDIIVPSEHVQNVISALVRCGMKPNPTKSFWTGRFRESCGEEFFQGERVSVVKLRRRLPESHRDASGVLGLVAFRNQLYQAGFWMTTALIDRWLAAMRLPMPIVEQTSPVVGRHSVAFGYRVERYHPSYQSPLVRGMMVRTIIPKSPASDHGKLLKCLLPGRVEPYQDRDHLTRSGRADSAAIKFGWGSPF